MATLKVYRNAAYTGQVHEIIPPAGTTLYSVWLDQADRRPVDIPVAAGTTSLKFFVDSIFTGAVWSDANVARSEHVRYWRNDLDPEAGNFTVPLTGGQGVDPGAGGGTAGVTQIIAGSNVTISPESGVGPVTVSASGGGGGTVSGGLFNPSTGAELQTAWQAALDGGYHLMCDPRARPIVTTPIMLKARDQGSQAHGIMANGMQLRSGMNGGTMVTIELAALQCRHMDVIRLGLEGYGPSDVKANGLLVKSRRAVGENGLYVPRIESLTVEGCQDGLIIDGYVFEGLIDAPRAANCDRSIVMRMDAGNILSNMLIRTPLLRACRVGIECEYANSVMITGSGSFIDISERAIVASNGCKLIEGCDFENAGSGFAIDIATSDFRMTMRDLTGSNTANNMPKLARYRGPPANFFRQNIGVIYQGDADPFTADSTVHG